EIKLFKQILYFLRLFQYDPINSFLFAAIAILFSVALMGNIILILLIRLDRRLHTPTYFLLSHLSFIDIMYISTTVPKMAINFLSNIPSMLPLVSQDTSQYEYIIVLSGLIILLLSMLPLVCQDTSQSEYTIVLSGLIILLLPFMAIVASYACVLTVVFHMSSGNGQKKAFSTCSCHLIVTSSFYVTSLSTYTRPPSLHSPEEDKIVAVFYTIGKYHSDTSHPIVSIHLTPQSNVLSTQLSFIDMMYFSTTMPKMAINFLSNSKTITFLGCKIQTFLFLTLGGTEALLLGFMSYDRYVAICHPLRYPLLMSKMICWFVVTCAWTSCSVNSLIHMLFAFQLPFCSS
ncbi:hypothetical protein EI555_001442, partial [Monodon monoceros]